MRGGLGAGHRSTGLQAAPGWTSAAPLALVGLLTLAALLTPVPSLAADVQRWGHVTCFVCGRCDKVCPTGIGIKAVSRAIVERFATADRGKEADIS